MSTDTVAEIGDTNRAGTVVITDTRWDSNGTLFVTVRERIGMRELDTPTLRAMRRLARRAIHHPEKTRSSRVVRTWHNAACMHATFAVSRLDPR